MALLLHLWRIDAMETDFCTINPESIPVYDEGCAAYIFSLNRTA